MENINMEQFNEVSKKSKFGEHVAGLIKEIRDMSSDKNIIRVATWAESQDLKKLYSMYGSAVDEYSRIMTLIKNCELELGLINQAMSTLDTNLVAESKFKKQLSILHNTLKSYMDSLYSNKQCVDRIVRFYEKTFSSFGL